MSTKQPQHIVKLRQTVQTGTLSPFIFHSFLEYQQQRRNQQWSKNKIKPSSQVRKKA